MNTAQRFYVVAVSVTVTLLLACGFASAAEPAPSTLTPEKIQGVYDKLCKSCHGSDGRGVATKAATLKIEPEKLNLGRPEVKGVPRDDQRKILLEGKEKMPPYAKKLKLDEIDPLLDLAIQLGDKIRAEKP